MAFRGKRKRVVVAASIAVGVVVGLSVRAVIGRADRNARRLYLERTVSDRPVQEPLVPARVAQVVRREAEALWIAGRVENEDGSPAFGARVLATVMSHHGFEPEPRGETRTDDRGRFVLRTRVARRFGVFARSEDSGRATPVELVGAGARDVVLRLQPAARVHVVTVDASGAPVRADRLVVKGHPGPGRVQRLGDGWSIDGLVPNRQYLVRAERRDLQPTADYVSVGSDASTVRLVFQPGAGVDVRFVTPAGRSIAVPIVRGHQGSEVLVPERSEDGFSNRFRSLAPMQGLHVEFGWHEEDLMIRAVPVESTGAFETATIPVDPPGSASVVGVPDGWRPTLSRNARAHAGHPEEGRWVFTDLWPGTYQLRIVLDEETVNQFAPVVSVTVRSGESTIVDSPRPRRVLEGRLEAPPECGRIVFVRLEAGGRSARCRVSPEGTYRFSASPGGETPGRLVAASADRGFLLATKRRADWFGRVLLGAHGGSSVRGRVLDSEGAPIVGARVRFHVTSPERWIRRTVYSDANGRFRFDGAGLRGVADISADAPGFERGTRRSVDPEVDVRITLAR